MAEPHIFKPLLARPSASHRLMNRSRGLVLATRVEPAFDSRTRRRGLLGRSGLSADSALAIAPSNAVHTFGMQFPIDVLFIGRGGLVLKRVRHLKPRRVALAIGAFAVLEFAADHEGIANTQVGDRLAIDANDLAV